MSEHSVTIAGTIARTIQTPYDASTTAAILVVSATFGSSGLAAETVSSVITESRPATPLRYTVDGQTYTWGMGQNQIMTGLVAGSERYDYADTVSRVELRRDDIAGFVEGNPCGVMVERLDDQGFLLSADYPSDGSGTGNCDMAELLASRTLNRGVLDLFSNVVPDAKNIERADFIFDHGMLAPLDSTGLSKAGHVVGEKRGNNPVKIAAILELDVFGQPSSYGPLVLVGGASCAETGTCYIESGAESTYAMFQNQFLSPQGFPTVTELSSERAAMALISAEDLGLAAGQVYFGFSLFADDVDSAVHVLTDPATFPDDTAFDNPVPGDDADVFGGLAGYLLGESLNIASGRVFLDSDADGFFGDADAGISDIALVIHADSDGNGLFDAAVDVALHSPIDSDLEGLFQLPGLVDGTYFVALDEQDAEIPTGLTLAPGTNPVPIVVGGDDVATGGADTGGADTGGADTGGADAGTLTEAISDTYTINQGETLTAPVLLNDTDAVGDGLTIVSVSDTPNATVEIVNDTLVYTPDFGFYGSETFRYTVQDAAGTASSGTVSVTVERFSDIDNDLINDFDQCALAAVDCSNLELETGIHGSGLGSLAWQSASADTLISGSAPMSVIVKPLNDADDQQAVPSGGAAAVEEVDFSQRFYFGVGAGASRLEPLSRNDALTVGDEFDTGIHVYGGYDLNRWLSAEVYFADLGAAGIDFLDNPVGEVDYQVYGINAVGYLLNSQSGLGVSSSSDNGLWRREGLSLYVKAGIGGLSNDSNVSFNQDYEIHANFGAGMEYGFSNGLALRADLTSYDTDAQYASISILKRFGSVSEPVERVQQPKAATAAPAPAAAPVPAPPVEPQLVMANQFAFDDASLSAETQATIDALIRDERDTNSILLIEGHTDWTGPEAYNQTLSERRADTVYNYLIEAGIEPSRLRVRGYGESQPISSNDTAAGRADNRRTEVFKR